MHAIGTLYSGHGHAVFGLFARKPLRDPTRGPDADARRKTTTCSQCACRCGVRVRLRDGGATSTATRTIRATAA
jgi:anaerobic selenocysteine-containing dehydrogenase